MPEKDDDKPDMLDDDNFFELHPELKPKEGKGLKIIGIGAVALAAGALAVSSYFYINHEPEYVPNDIGSIVMQLQKPPEDERWVLSDEYVHADYERALFRSGDSYFFFRDPTGAFEEGTGLSSLVRETGPDRLTIDKWTNQDRFEAIVDSSVIYSTEFDDGYDSSDYSMIPESLQHDRKNDIAEVIGGPDGGALVMATGDVSFDKDLETYLIEGFASPETRMMLNPSNEDQVFFLDAAIKKDERVTVYGKAGELWDYGGNANELGQARGETGIITALELHNVSAFGKNISE